MTPADRIEELEAEVAYLKGELGLSVKISNIRDVKSALGIARQQAEILCVLYGVYPRILTRWQLWDAIDHPSCGDDAYASNSICVRVSGIRKKLGPEVFANERHLGVGLSQAGCELVASCLKPSTDSSPGHFAAQRSCSLTPREQAYSVPEKRSACA